MQTAKKAVRPFGIKDKIGYMFGDFGNDFTFVLSSSFMMKFYTDVMGIEGAVVGILMMASRFIDAFTDVTMGQIVDRSKPNKHGKFRPWILRMCGPVAIASFLIYQSGFAGMSYGFKVVWMTITYILWGSIFYTAVNIPYGSMASALTEDPVERTSLSTWRTMGGMLANLCIGVGVPLVAYVTVDGNKVFSGSRMTMIAGIFSVCAIICYLICFKLTEERVQIPANTEKLNLGKLFKSLLTNRSLLGIILAAIFVLLAQLTMSSMANYVFPNYYGNTAAQSMSSLVGTVAMMVICAPLATKLSAAIGKKELATASCLIGAVVWLVCLIVRPQNAFVYVVFYALGFIAMGFFNTIIWAMITDVIDDAELKNGVREDGTIYSVYSFARKLGQALSAGLSGVLLSLVGYTEATAFDPEVVTGIFNISCISPAIGFAAVALVLIFFYPLSKKRVEENCAKLAAKRK